MAESATPITLGNRKLVVLGIPWDVDTAGLRQYMSKYGELADVIVMKDRATGRSRGFGYVTFQTPEEAEKAMATEHVLNGRMLEVKIATPKENMQPPPGKKSSRIFVARIPSTVTEDMFKSYFEKFGAVTDVYMPKDQETRAHRGIGFVTFESSDSVDKIMNETHELAGSSVAVDRATPKDETGRNGDKAVPPYGIFNSYLNAARLGYFGVPPFFPFDFSGSGFSNDMGGGSFGNWQQPRGGSGNLPSGKESGSSGAVTAASRNYDSPSTAAASKAVGRKIFIGRIPSEATTDDVRHYFSNFGRLLDVYLPKDKNKATHRGFGFVTFAEDGVAERVAARTHTLLGQTLAIDRAAPLDEAPGPGSFYSSGAGGSGSLGAGGPIRGGSNSSAAGSAYGGLHGYDYSSMWGAYGSGVGGSDLRSSHMEPRYRPY